MKKLLMTVMALSCFAFSSYGQKKVEKQIIGKWCNPYTLSLIHISEPTRP